MNIKDHLLACVSEEGGEIVQAAGKALRFGLLDKNPGTGGTNWVDLRKEVHDLVAVYEMLCDEFDRVETLDRGLIEAKKVKVEHYMAYASERGRLNQ
jgi:NTP pyrophosphatase (non-canonical NTP hydrolase)